MNQSYARINAPYTTLACINVFAVQLYKNDTRALLSRILNILNSDWLQHARSVRGGYEVWIAAVATYTLCSICDSVSRLFLLAGCQRTGCLIQWTHSNDWHLQETLWCLFLSWYRQAKQLLQLPKLLSSKGNTGYEALESISNHGSETYY